MKSIQAIEKIPASVTLEPGMEFYLSQNRQWLMWARFWLVSVEKDLFFMDWESAFERSLSEDRTRVTHLGLMTSPSQTSLLWRSAFQMVQEVHKDKPTFVELGCLWAEGAQWWMAILGHFHVLGLGFEGWRLVYSGGDHILRLPDGRICPSRGFQNHPSREAHLLTLFPGASELVILPTLEVHYKNSSPLSVGKFQLSAGGCG